ncbi:MAG: ComEC/Rec2 family competence protein [Acidimicrobiia bacterium]
MRRARRWDLSAGLVYCFPPAIAAGVLIGERLGPGSAGGLLVAAVLVLLAATRAGSGWRAVLVLVGLALLACGLERRALDGLVHSALTRPVAERADAEIRGRLVGDPDGSRWTTRVLVRVDDVRLVDRASVVAATPHRGRAIPVGRTVLVMASDRAASRLVVLSSGDRVTLVGWLRPLDGFDLRWRWRHAVARFDARDLLAASSSGALIDSVANATRGAVLRGADLLPATERALVAGFLVGDTRDLPDDVIQQFRDAGLSHLLAVSGANLAFVFALVDPVLRRLGRSPRLVATVAVLAVFGAMTRWEPSVLRAGAMVSVAVLAAHAGRPARGVRVLALAVSGLLLLDPFLLHSVGFGLSVGATLGITLLAAPCARRLRGPLWLRDSLGTTLAAQVGVLPVLVPVFGSLPLVSVPANLLAVPLAAPLTIWGLAAGAVAGLLASPAPGIAEVLQLPTLVLADGVLGIAAAAATAPLAVDAEALGVAIAIAGAIAAAVGMVRATRRDRRMLARRGADQPSQRLPAR